MLLGYCRVSTDDKGQTIQTQAHQIATRGYAVSMLFVDVGVSGAKAPTEREGMKRLLNVVKAGDTVVITAQDRISRDVEHTRKLVLMLNKKGVKVLSLREGELNMLTPVGKMYITMSATIAEFDRGVICERVKSGMARAKAEGKHIGRPKNTIHQERIQELKQAGMSVSEIAKELSISRPTVYKALK